MYRDFQYTIHIEIETEIDSDTFSLSYNLHIVYRHWQDTGEITTLTVELWNTVGGINCRVFTAEYRTCVHFIHM